MHAQLFEGKRVFFAPIDYEKDPEIESRWTHDPEYIRMLSTTPARPMSSAQVKKKYEKLEKDIEESHNHVFFAVHSRTTPGGEPLPAGESRLIGFAELFWIEWTHGNGNIRLGIGEADYRGHGFGPEIINLLLRYAFYELNLFRLSVVVPEYNQAALRLFLKAGFVEEVRRREALNRDGQRWDLLSLGLLSEEWERTITA